ncbi:hypothetical protein HPS57_02500 [Prevotella sp. PINT]|jgi:hypothetical protein|uniref:hypothetical protein n=1 Tax=Palleniella intestinalis TaxID=2736291 RepID=UPI001551CCBB|nr:hypothetical protein [Palleniella intestinalis]NPD80848.1 hypothetical protein [Palleniella intestinalis]
MGFLDKLFGKKHDDKEPGMEDFMTLIRVYFQASIAANAGITNLAMLPDLRVFKSTLKVATVNNKLGVGERVRCRKMLTDMYGLDEMFYKEVDQSVKKNCRKMQDVQVYLVQFQTLTQELMMLLGNVMKFKLRLPSFFKGTLRTMTEKTVNEVFTKNDYNDPATMKTVMELRNLSKRLGFSEQWISAFAFQLIMLAKKESAAKDQ